MARRIPSTFAPDARPRTGASSDQSASRRARRTSPSGPRSESVRAAMTLVPPKSRLSRKCAESWSSASKRFFPTTYTLLASPSCT